MPGVGHYNPVMKLWDTSLGKIGKSTMTYLGQLQKFSKTIPGSPDYNTLMKQKIKGGYLGRTERVSFTSDVEYLSSINPSP